MTITYQYNPTIQTQLPPVRMYTLIHLIIAEAIGATRAWLFLGGADLLALASTPSVLLRRQGRPLAAMSWLLALFVVPYLGVLWWWLVGREHMQRKRRLRQKSTEEFCACLDEFETDKPSKSAMRAFDGLLPHGLFHGYGHLELYPPSRNNQVELLVDGHNAFATIEEMIEGAESYIHLLFFIWKTDETGRRLRDALVEKARQGVEVRVLVDGMGSPDFEKELAGPLVEAGGQVGIFLPPTYLSRRPTFNFRNHRKLIVFDGEEAFTGGMNVGEEYEHTWHDLAIRVRGPVVQQLHTVFLDDWYFATAENLATERYVRVNMPPRADTPALSVREANCAVIASGPDTEHDGLRDALFHAINAANDRLWMTTPYFIPGADILAALRAAVQRGVDVKLILPEESDVAIVRRASRAYYPMLLESGIRLFEYQPRVLHAKSLLVDQSYAMMGSANLDVRSFKINFEVTTFVASSEFNKRVASVFEADLDQCREVDRTEIRSHSVLSNLTDALAHLTSPML
ncbi:MAG: cardiolipin synthase [Bradymonadaceae bacterium]